MLPVLNTNRLFLNAVIFRHKSMCVKFITILVFAFDLPDHG